MPQVVAFVGSTLGIGATAATVVTAGGAALAGGVAARAFAPSEPAPVTVPDITSQETKDRLKAATAAEARLIRQRNISRAQTFLTPGGARGESVLDVPVSRAKLKTFLGE